MAGVWTRRLIAIEFLVAVLVIVYAGFRDIPGVLAGTPPPISSDIVARCGAASGAACGVQIMRLNRGRYRVWTTTPAETLTVDLAPTGASRPRDVMVRLATPNAATLAIGSATRVDVAEGGRVVAPVDGAGPLTLTFTAAPGSAAGPIVVDELGVYANGTGLLSDPRRFFGAIPPARYHGTIVPRAVAALCVFTLVAALFLPSARLRQMSPIVLPIVCLSLCFIDLAILYSPYFDRDLRVRYASGPLQEPAGANLNEGLYQASNLLAGEGLTTRDGVAPWERMPGYGLFCTLAATLFGHDTLVDLAVSAVLLQTLFYSAALGVFAWAAMRIFPPAGVWAAGLIVAWLPKQLGLTQVDAIIAPVMLLLLAALCLRVHAMRKGEVPLAIDVVVHLAFALWFLMRPDILPGWVVMSAVLHWRTLRRLAIPLALFLVIGGTSGLYRARHHREFSFTTTSAGAGLFCGLWEVPSRFRFAMACNDDAYFDWVKAHSPYVPQSAAANSFVTREVIRFWLTYPGHVVVMVYHKMLQAIDGDIWPGYPTTLQASVFARTGRAWLSLLLLAVIALCLATGYQRERALLLAWPVVLNAPVFWLVFSSLGRFYSGAGTALIVAGTGPLFERSFYSALVGRRGRTAIVLACVVLFAATAHAIDGWLLRTDAFHYWTPFLDPAKSPLNEFK